MVEDPREQERPLEDAPSEGLSDEEIDQAIQEDYDILEALAEL